MTISTFDELKTEISNHLDRDDLTNDVETFIRLAEARHERDIRVREMYARATATVTDRYLALPSDLLEMKNLRLLTDPVTVLDEVSIHEMNRVRVENSGKPRYYTVHADIEFDREPDEDYTAEMVYYARFGALSDDNTTNGLLDRAPDVYLYGALIAAEPFLGNDERVALWSQLYNSGVSLLNDTNKRRAGPLVSRPSGSTP